MIAVSTDDASTLKKWRDELKAPLTFVSDKQQRLVKLFDTKMPVIGMAARRTFVIGAGRKVLEVIEGMEAIDPTKSIHACSLHPPKPQNVDAATSSQRAEEGSNRHTSDAGYQSKRLDAGAKSQSIDADSDAEKKQDPPLKW